MSEEKSETLDLRAWLRPIAAHRRLIAIVTMVVLAATATINLSLTPHYRAQIRILIERNNARVVSFEEIYRLGTGAADYYLTQYEILESRAIAERAMRKLSAEDQAWFEQGNTDPVRKFLAMRRIRPVLKSRLVDIEAEHPDPALAGRVATAMVAAYIQDGKDRRRSASTSAIRHLKEDAGELREQLVAAQEAAQRFKTENRIVSTNDRQTLMSVRLENLSEELSQIERRRREAEARLLTAASTVKNEDLIRNLPEVMTNAVIGSFKRSLLAARAEMSQLAHNYKPKHPRMLGLKDKIASLRGDLEREVCAVYEGMKEEHGRAIIQEANVRGLLEDQKKAILAMAAKLIQYDILRDEAENTRRLHDTMLSRLKEIEVIDGYDTTNVHPIGSVEISKSPVRPRKILNMFLALVVGLALGGLSAFAHEFYDMSLKTAADASRVLEMPVLGLVPLLEGKRKVRGPVDSETLDPHSAISEAFRTIRTSLVFSEAGKDVRSLLVTSCAREDGKSLVSINVATSYARAGRRVLLVDGDMRRPYLHRAFEASHDEGFSSLLIGRRDIEDLVQPTQIENLSFMPCGVIPPNPVELLANGMTPEVLDHMLAQFDMVVFDTPPVGTVSDACVLGTIVERVLFVVRSHATDRRLGRRIVEQLRTVGCSLAGLIMNQTDSRAERYSRDEYLYQSGYVFDEQELSEE